MIKLIYQSNLLMVPEVEYSLSVSVDDVIKTISYTVLFCMENNVREIEVCGRIFCQNVAFKTKKK